MRDDKSFQKILIANRGEIAVRVIEACRDLGIATVALYTGADRTWLARELADEAVYIGAGPAADSYINFDKVIDAAKRTGADAIHPGYGFLAENAAFARRCEEEGIVFIGPSAEVIDLMGNKAKAKALVESLDVPVIPGLDAADLSDDDLRSAANDMGYPLMLKAVAGGGGMGIRIVNSVGEFADALASVRQEARSAFGDDRLLMEKYFPAVRHIEVQVLADAFGKVVHCYERECSVQRRRQKVIEEAPSAFVSERLREQLCTASARIAEAVGYRGVGTVEFVVVDNESVDDPKDKNAADQFYFLEMNTRLQVEHGVTEAVTGLDLVRLQIAAAEGRPLPLQQTDIPLSGHAIECRLCAESPSKGFQPQTGTVQDWSVPHGDNLRVDTGIRAGTNVSVFYDSLLAKLIATGDTREQALRAMADCLPRTRILGLDTNQHFLSRILADAVFIEGRANTTYIQNNEQSLLAPLDSTALTEIAIVGALAAALEDTRHLGPGQGGAFTRNYDLVLGDLVLEETDLVVTLAYGGANDYQATLGERDYQVQLDVSDSGLRIAIDGIEKCYQTYVEGNHLYLHLPGRGSFTLTRASALPEESLDDHHHGYTATMAGQVVAVLTEPGAEINAGDKLLVIESMKMEHSVIAQSAGAVDAVHVKAGDTVQAGTLLLSLV